MKLHIFVLLLLITGCAEEQAVKIGVVAAQTGPVATVSVPSQNGARLALEDWNANHETKFELIFEDNQGKATESLKSYNKLVQVDNVVAVLSDISMTTLSLAPLADENRKLLIAFISTPPSVRGIGDFVYRTSPMNIAGLTLSIDHMLENDIIEIATLTEQYDYPISLEETFAKEFRKKGGRIIASEQFLASDDLRSVITKSTKDDPGALMIFVQTPPTAVNLLRQIRELGISIPVYGNEVLGSDMSIRVGGADLMEGVIAGFPAYNFEKTENLKQKYTAKYGENILDWLYVASGYDAAMVLFEAIDEVGTDNEAIKIYLDNLENFDGYVLESFDDEGDVELGSYVLLQIKNGKKVRI